jgi:hypothetical protein
MSCWDICKILNTFAPQTELRLPISGVQYTCGSSFALNYVDLIDGKFPKMDISCDKLLQLSVSKLVIKYCIRHSFHIHTSFSAVLCNRKLMSIERSLS